MKKQVNYQAALKPLAAAVAMALATPAAFAAVSSTQTPGEGYVLLGGNSSTTTTVKNVSGTPNGTEVISVSGAAKPIIIQWGGTKPNGAQSTVLNPNGTAGFDIGAGATVAFVGNATTAKTPKSNTAPILNIDATGNPSQILGTLENSYTGYKPNAAPLYVANANGIVVGSSAVIDAPAGLGLINADLTSTNAQAVFTSAGAVPISFEGATGGVTIEAGANLANVGTPAGGGFLLVAGAGNVNVQGAFVSNGGNTSYAINSAVPVTIDAGVGGHAAVGSAHFVAQDSSGTGVSSGFANLKTTNYNNGGLFMYTDAPGSAVTLNLGISTSPYDASSLYVIADGNINLATGSDLTNVTIYFFDWSGLLTNNGILDYGLQTGSTLNPTRNAAAPYANGVIYGNTTTAQYGGFYNATSGLINAGSIYFYGASFSNAGTLQMGDAGTHPTLSVTATKGNINLGGTVDVVGVGSYTGPTALGDLRLNAAVTADQSVTVDTTPLTVSGANGATIAATNVNVGSSITVSGGDFTFHPYGAVATNGAPVSGAFVIASGATLSAVDLFMGTQSSNGNKAYTSYNIDGALVAKGGGSNTGSVKFGNTAGTVAPFNVSGGGSITAGSLTFNNLQGSVNNITSGQILANGFQLIAPSSQPMTITVTANGAAPQGFNVMVKGDATISSGSTAAVKTQSPAGNTKYTQYLYPPNANSNLVVQTTGNLTVNPSQNAPNPYNLSTTPGFQWPGLVYLQANGGQLTSTTAIANAYGAQAEAGHAGVFLIAQNITDNYPIYTNGNAGVVFAAPYDAAKGIYPYATTINGVNPMMASGMPLVYFAQANTTTGNANFSLQPLGTFTNENGYQQENQTFLTLP